MKKLLALGLLALLAAGCASPTQPAFTDNGKPGQIRAMVFYDQNANGKLDAGEPGLSDSVGISQDVSCPASNVQKVIQADSDATGLAIFPSLKPGRYCVGYMGKKTMTTQLSTEVNVSSEQDTQVVFGLSEQ